MSARSDRRLGWHSVDYADGSVQVWMNPLWLKDDRLVLAEIAPKTARELAVRLLQAADAAEVDQ